MTVRADSRLPPLAASAAGDGHWGGAEPESLGGKLVEMTEMLHDGDAGGKQSAVRGTLAASGAVDVQRIDSYKSRALLDEPCATEELLKRAPASVDFEFTRTMTCFPAVPISAS